MKKLSAFAFVLLAIVAVILLLPAAICAATNPVDVVKGIGNVNQILTAVFGVGLLGALGWVAKLKIGANKLQRCVTEWTIAIAKIKATVTDPELRKDVDDALEATADVAEVLNLKKQAAALRNAL